MEQTKPTYHRIWKKLLNNPLAITGFLIIAIAVMISLFAYQIVPDNTRHANRMVLEIGGKSPGYKQLFLLLENDERTNTQAASVWGSQPDLVTYIPIDRYEQYADSLVYFQFIDEGVQERKVFMLPQGTVPYKIQERSFWLGTDKYGRDMLSRLILGTRVSLSVGIIAVIISLSLGVFAGLLAGYFRGKIDNFIVWLMNVLWSIPTLLLVFAITLLLGKGFWQVFIAVGLTMWVNVARMVRGQVLSIRELEYVEAARALGYNNSRIIFRHILPNIWGPILVLAAANFASAIVLEAGLSFLGVGVQAPQPSWGLMIRENFNFIITEQPFLALIPGLAIMLLVLAFNFLGNGLKDALDVR